MDEFHTVQVKALVAGRRQTMTIFIIQSLLLIAVAFILGCLVGALLHWLFADKPHSAIEPVEAKPEPMPLVAEPKPDPKPKTPPKPSAKKEVPPPPPPPPSPTAKKDDLKRIRGIGPQNEARLNSIGITTFAQVAAWKAADQRDIGERLSFPGRIEREDWVKQAKVLAKGETTAFAKRVDKGEVDSSVGEGTVGDLGKKPPVVEGEPADGKDNLTLIEGVGNALERKLFALGVYRFDQIAHWNDDHCVWIGNELGFPGRPERENWVAEAKVLAEGGSTPHSKKVERGEIKTSRKTRL
ncbi:MAG: FtsX-like permease family protein [Pseudomonadota bacterium]